MSKRRKGFPSEARVKRGHRVVHGDKDLVEKLGRNDLCPCGSGRRFQALLPPERALPGRRAGPLLLGSDGSTRSARWWPAPAIRPPPLAASGTPAIDRPLGRSGRGTDEAVA
ncbi:MAG: SEC-C metal-binding domain-containing protein [Alphaproteobacteria bacterium]|nr:SEC-C metal-binding domain-containing protein [Alphaproteobacteria bacterium]